jgi:hypothetical protein
MLFFSVFVHRATPTITSRPVRAVYLHAYDDGGMHGRADYALSKLAKIPSCPLLIWL